MMSRGCLGDWVRDARHGSLIRTASRSPALHIESDDLQYFTSGTIGRIMRSRYVIFFSATKKIKSRELFVQADHFAASPMAGNYL